MGSHVPNGRFTLGGCRPPDQQNEGSWWEGRTAVQLEGPVGRGGVQAESHRCSSDHGLPAGEKHLLLRRGVVPRALDEGLSSSRAGLRGKRTPEERPPAQAGPAHQHPVVLALRLPCERGLRGWPGLGPARRPTLDLRTPSAAPCGKVRLCVPPGWEGPENSVYTTHVLGKRSHSSGSERETRTLEAPGRRTHPLPRNPAKHCPRREAQRPRGRLRSQ